MYMMFAPDHIYVYTYIYIFFQKNDRSFASVENFANSNIFIG